MDRRRSAVQRAQAERAPQAPQTAFGRLRASGLTGCPAMVTFKMRSDRRADPTRHRGRRVSRGLDCDDAVGQSTLVPDLDDEVLLREGVSLARRKATQ